MFDIVKKGKTEIQIKLLDSNMDVYKRGGRINLVDGIYFGYEGSFVVRKHKIVAIFDSSDIYMFDKWGGALNHPNLSTNNPLLQYVKSLKNGKE